MMLQCPRSRRTTDVAANHRCRGEAQDRSRGEAQDRSRGRAFFCWGRKKQFLRIFVALMGGLARHCFVINKNIEIEIVIVSNANKKSLKVINLCKRLIDGGVSVYWHCNSAIFNDSLFFAIFDKTFLVDKPNSEQISENAEELVRIKNSFFKSVLVDSEKLKLLSGEINIEFSADKTIIKNGVFTSCKRNDDCPPWQLSAKEIKHDKKKK